MTRRGGDDLSVGESSVSPNAKLRSRGELEREPWSWEPTQDILDYLGFAGVETTRDQLARLHRRRLIGEPFHDQNGGRSSLARYPPVRRSGCFESRNCVRARSSWTSGVASLVGGFRRRTRLIRTYLLKRATRWDEATSRDAHVAGDVQEDDKGERDVLEEVFFEHLKVGPAMVSARNVSGEGPNSTPSFRPCLLT